MKIKRQRMRISGSDGTDVDPMSGMANLADAMLVFACGLMMALVTYWNVSLSPDAKEVMTQQDAQEVVDVEALTSGAGDGESLYDRLGEVYQDPQTGKMYLVEYEDSEEEGSN